MRHPVACALMWSIRLGHPCSTWSIFSTPSCRSSCSIQTQLTLWTTRLPPCSWNLKSNMRRRLKSTWLYTPVTICRSLSQPSHQLRSRNRAAKPIRRTRIQINCQLLRMLGMLSRRMTALTRRDTMRVNWVRRLTSRWWRLTMKSRVMSVWQAQCSQAIMLRLKLQQIDSKESCSTLIVM